MIGSQLGTNYRVLEKLDEGGMGVVYLVEHTTLRKHFAVKVLAADLAANPEALQRFEIEAHAASKLEHENIVNVTDYGIAIDGRPYLVMERLKGQPLSRRIAAQPLSLQETVAVIVPVCHALAAAHHEGFVHRDIKPENIFLTQRHTGGFGVKVLDFGLTRLRGGNVRVTKLGHALGSPLYMSPEMCRGDEVDSRADIYSLGVLLYQLVCGRLPFAEENLLKVLHMHTFDAPPLPHLVQPAVAPELEHVILTALAKDPAERYQTVEELEQALLAALPAAADAWLRVRHTPMPIRLSASGRVATAETFPSLPTISASGTPSGSVPTTPSGSVPTTPSITASSTAAIAVSAPPRRKRWALTAVLLVLGGATAGILVTAGTERAPTSVPRAVAPPAAPLPAAPPPAAPPPRAEVALAAQPLAPPPAPATVRLQITTAPAGARVELDGVLLGSTPLDLAVARPSAPQTLTITADGHVPITRALAGSDLALDVSLDAVPEAPARKRPRTKATAPATNATRRDNDPLEIRGAR